MIWSGFESASVLSASIVKLIVLPGLGFMGFRFLGLSPQDYLPGLIILATPTATITMVMAYEIGGDMDFAAATVSVEHPAVGDYIFFLAQTLGDDLSRIISEKEPAIFRQNAE